MLQVNGEWVYEDLTPENTIKLLEDLKKGTDKKGPQIDRNDCEGPQGRTTLKVILFIFRVLIQKNKLGTKEISWKQSKIGKKQKRRESKLKKRKLNKQKESKKKEEKQRLKKFE